MIKLFDDLHLIDGIGEAHVFLLGSPEGYCLIDSGIFKRTHTLIAGLEESGFPLSNLRTIVLTHCHCDHIGGVSELVRASGASVAAHPDDIPYILQQAVIPGPYHNMMVQEQKYMQRLGCRVARVDKALKDGETIDALGGLRVIHTPGHTPGSIAFYQPERQIMFFGDVIRNHPKRGLEIGVPEEFNVDTPRTRVDARKLLRYPIEYALFSHGRPILGNAGGALARLVEGVNIDRP